MKNSAMKIGMMACCVVMFIPILFYFVAGGALAGVTGNLAAFAPLLICGAAHLLMFKLMGKPCHGSEKTTEAMPVVERQTDIPNVRTATQVAAEH